jgi:hypothetical protein
VPSNRIEARLSWARFLVCWASADIRKIGVPEGSVATVIREA